MVHILNHAPSTPEREALIAERQALGLDHRDEIWEGYYVVSPVGNSKHARLQAQLCRAMYESAFERGLTVVAEFNLGSPADFRVPDGGVLADRVDAVFLDTALIVIEVLSPNDDSYRKFGFYRRHNVTELLIVDPGPDTVQWYRSGEETYEPTDRSVVLGMTATNVAKLLTW